jgi:lipid-A-disaccharide synthase-like uncharacterized protein
MPQADVPIANAFLPFLLSAVVTTVLFGTQWLVELFTAKDSDSRKHLPKGAKQ